MCSGANRRKNEGKGMKLSGKLFYMGCTCRPSFKDPTKMTYQVGFMEGLDSMKVFVDQADYAFYAVIPMFSPVEVVYDYNPVTGRMNLFDVKVISEEAGGTGEAETASAAPAPTAHETADAPAEPMSAATEKPSSRKTA